MQCTRFKHQRRHSKHKLDSVLYPEMGYPPANCLKPRFPQRHHAWRDPSLGWSSLGDHLQTLVKLQIERKTKNAEEPPLQCLTPAHICHVILAMTGWGDPEMNIAWIRSLGTTGATFRELCHGGDRKVISSSVPHSKVSNFVEAAQKKSAVKKHPVCLSFSVSWSLSFSAFWSIFWSCKLGMVVFRPSRLGYAFGLLFLLLDKVRKKHKLTFWKRMGWAGLELPEFGVDYAHTMGWRMYPLFLCLALWS